MYNSRTSLDTRIICQIFIFGYLWNSINKLIPFLNSKHDVQEYLDTRDGKCQQVKFNQRYLVVERNVIMKFYTPLLSFRRYNSRSYFFPLPLILFLTLRWRSSFFASCLASSTSTQLITIRLGNTPFPWSTWCKQVIARDTWKFSALWHRRGIRHFTRVSWTNTKFCLVSYLVPCLREKWSF